MSARTFVSFLLVSLCGIALAQRQDQVPLGSRPRTGHPVGGGLITYGGGTPSKTGTNGGLGLKSAGSSLQLLKAGASGAGSAISKLGFGGGSATALRLMRSFSSSSSGAASRALGMMGGGGSSGLAGMGLQRQLQKMFSSGAGGGMSMNPGMMTSGGMSAILSALSSQGNMGSMGGIVAKLRMAKKQKMMQMSAIGAMGMSSKFGNMGMGVSTIGLTSGGGGMGFQTAGSSGLMSMSSTAGTTTAMKAAKNSFLSASLSQRSTILKKLRQQAVAVGQIKQRKVAIRTTTPEGAPIPPQAPRPRDRMTLLGSPESASGKIEESAAAAPQMKPKLPAPGGFPTLSAMKSAAQAQIPGAMSAPTSALFAQQSALPTTGFGITPRIGWGGPYRTIVAAAPILPQPPVGIIVGFSPVDYVKAQAAKVAAARAKILKLKGIKAAALAEDQDTQLKQTHDVLEVQSTLTGQVKN